MATTTNYSWTTPDDTALVKDGAAAIRSLGTAIDTTVFNNAGAAIAKATVDAKGDLIVGTADNTVGRLAVGTNGHTLVADSAEATGLKWQAPAAAGGMTLISTTTLSGSTTSLTTIAGTYKHLLLIIQGSTATGNYQYTVRPNGTTSNFRGVRCNTTTLAHTNNANLAAMTTDASSSNTVNAYAIWIYNYADSTYVKNVDLFGDMENASGDGIPNFARGIFNLTNAITSIDIVCTSTFNGGQALLYGVS